VDLNLETLKTEILDYLAASEFAVFRSHPGALDAQSVITWDVDRFPDYRMFLEPAQKLGLRMVLFASREFDESEVDEALEEMQDAELSREEAREFEKRLRDARRHVGDTCGLELAFGYNSHLYVYEVQPDWYEEFIETVDELASLIPAGEDFTDDGTDGIGGYYSNN
jgi:hypothetical protein